MTDDMTTLFYKTAFEFTILGASIVGCFFAYFQFLEASSDLREIEKNISTQTGIDLIFNKDIDFSLTKTTDEEDHELVEHHEVIDYKLLLDRLFKK